MTNKLLRRREQLVETLKIDGLDAAAIVPGPNFYFYTGLRFLLMERPTLLFVTVSGEMFAIIPALERLAWEDANPNAKTFYWQDSDGYDAAFAAACALLGDAELGVEGQRMRAFEFMALRTHLGTDSIRDAQGTIAAPRLCKSDEEVALLQRAVEVTELSLEETVSGISIGQTEEQIRSTLMSRMFANGAEDLAFGPIVLTGANAANPHGVSGDRPTSAGDALLFDIGVTCQGYSSDITRTFFCGHVRDEHAEIYSTVLAANSHGRQITREGLTCAELDHEVTEVMRRSAFGDLIVHKTGHGLGLDVHEAPQIMIGNETELKQCMVITIEPGLYRADEIGVRIEDDVLVGKDGCRSLTQFPRDLRIVGGSV